MLTHQFHNGQILLAPVRVNSIPACSSFIHLTYRRQSEIKTIHHTDIPTMQRPILHDSFLPLQLILWLV